MTFRPRLALVALLFSIPAAAEPTRLSNEGRADQLFRSAEKKFDSGDHAGACVDFSESLKIGPKLGTLLNLALCHETIGKLVTAWSEFSHGAAWAAQNNQRDRLDFAMQHIRSLEPRLPRVVLQLPPERALSGIDLDGEPLPEPRWYLPLFLDPGEHRIAVSAPGKERTSVAFRVILAPTDQIVAIPSLGDAPSVREAPPSAKEPPPQENTTKRMLGFVGLGLGGAGIATGATFGVLGITGNERDAQSRVTVSTIAFTAGVVVALTGVWLLATSRSR